MFEINGKYTNAQVMIDVIEEGCFKQIQGFVNHPAFTNPVAIMPDTHAGKGSVIGFTMPMTDKTIPNVIGVDIGCGIRAVKFNFDFDSSLNNLATIDKNIRKHIPLGFEVNSHALCNIKDVVEDQSEFLELCKKIGADSDNVEKSIGSLGGGNHFIEIGKDLNNEYWLTIHTGSRNFGLKVANYYQKLAESILKESQKSASQSERDRILSSVPPRERGAALKAMHLKYNIGLPKDLAWLEDGLADEYIRAMVIAQDYAQTNREIIIDKILKTCNFTAEESIESVHNYIDPTDKIIRKGAIRAYTYEKMIIPFNMRDGILICEGRSNKDWNYSAPHGAGRVMSRSAAKKNLKLNKFQEQMQDVFSTSVNASTLDEAPDCYKSSNIIEDAIAPTAKIINRIIPIYNLKASTQP